MNLLLFGTIWIALLFFCVGEVGRSAFDAGKVPAPLTWWAYAIGAVLSFPVTIAFLIGVGNAFFNRPLDFKLAIVGFVGWLVIALAVAALASLLPANKAASTTVREALAYE